VGRRQAAVVSNIKGPGLASAESKKSAGSNSFIYQAKKGRGAREYLKKRTLQIGERKLRGVSND